MLLVKNIVLIKINRRNGGFILIKFKKISKQL